MKCLWPSQKSWTLHTPGFTRLVCLFVNVFRQSDWLKTLGNLRLVVWELIVGCWICLLKWFKIFYHFLKVLQERKRKYSYIHRIKPLFDREKAIITLHNRIRSFLNLSGINATESSNQNVGSMKIFPLLLHWYLL